MSLRNSRAFDVKHAKDDPVDYGANLLSDVVMGEPYDQMGAAVVFAIIAIKASLLSFGLTAGFVILFTMIFFVGLLRVLLQSQQ